MLRWYDCRTTERGAGLAAAATAVRRGELVVLPTDTVYGLGADPAHPAAVGRLLRAKGRGRTMPSPVLISSPAAVTGVVSQLPPQAWDLIEKFWPGGLTLIARQEPSLHWDLGETAGTVAVRMPAHPVALELLLETGPLAVSSANLTGAASPQTCHAAEQMLGAKAAVYLDAGPTPTAVASTIIDLTATVPVLIRAGAVSVEQLRTVIPDLHDPAETGTSGR